MTFFTSFILGLLTPLTAVCVLPLVPGFLVYLSNQIGTQTSKLRTLMLGVIMTLGVILFMGLIGVVFSLLLQISLTNVIGIISPIAFGTLAIFSILLIFNVDIGKFLPKFKSPVAKSPILSSFLFGFFFGAIVLPCNPLFIAAMFSRALTFTDLTMNIINFIFFGFGMGFPLIFLSAVSAATGTKLVSFLSKNKRILNLISGVIMLGISIYYMFFVFRILR
ncbi:hypothetical protein BVX95_00835 [archaeon D22]|nr:hypothetical protein BVX95_00835 [archaeon D22]